MVRNKYIAHNPAAELEEGAIQSFGQKSVYFILCFVGRNLCSVARKPQPELKSNHSIYA